MDIRETLSVAIDALRSNKLRAILTSLGVIIGSASIVLVVTVALTSKNFVLSQIESIGSNLVWVELVQRPDKPQPLSYEMSMEDMEAAKNIPNVIHVAGTRELPMAVIANGAERPVSVVGVTDGYQAIRRLVILRGRYFDAADMEMRSKVCLITPQLSDRIFGQDNPVGKSVRMGDLTFTVIGVFRERAETLDLSDLHENSVIVPFTVMKYYTGLEVVRLLDVQAARSEDVPSVVIVIAFIALVISGIGIMNIMLVTVKERTREIGIRKAIGAARREIMYQFLIESFVISGGGAVIGILIGIAVPVVIQLLFLPGNLRVPVSGLSVIIAFVVSCSTGLFFGYLPANQAASLEPVESLRYE